MNKERTIRVVVKLPGVRPEIRTIENKLDTFQALVGGWIESPSLSDGTEFIVNEEGKLNGLDPNFYAKDLQDLVVGPAIFVKADADSGEYVSLSEDEADRIVGRFKDIKHYAMLPGIGLVGALE